METSLICLPGVSSPNATDSQLERLLDSFRSVYCAALSPTIQLYNTMNQGGGERTLPYIIKHKCRRQVLAFF